MIGLQAPLPPQKNKPMTLEPLIIVELLVLGVGTGFLAGLLGIGGGMIMVPFLTYIMSTRGISPDLAVKMAIATSMSTIIFTSISSVRAHHKRGAVRWDIVKGLSPGIVLGALLASLGVFALLKGSWLAIFFGLFVAFSATQMFLGRFVRLACFFLDRRLGCGAPIDTDGEALIWTRPLDVCFVIY